MKKLSVCLLFAASCALVSCGSDNSITVSFDWNYETTEAAPSSIKVNPGSAYGTLPSPSFARTGYDFGGWFISKKGSGTAITSTTIVNENAGDHTLYASWDGQSFVITFDLQGGNINEETTIPTANVTYGDLYGALTIPDDPTKKGSQFVGWNLVSDGSGAYITSSSKVETAVNHTLFAIFKDLKSKYTFDDATDINDFGSNDGALTFVVDKYGEDNKLKVTNSAISSNSQRLKFMTPLDKNTPISIDFTFIGDLGDNYVAGIWVYGASPVGDPIVGGEINNHMEQGLRSKWVSGSSISFEGGSTGSWKDEHTITFNLTTREDCSGLVFMMEFAHATDSAYADSDPTAWNKNIFYIDNLDINRTSAN